MSGNNRSDHTLQSTAAATLIRTSLADQFDLLEIPVSVHTVSFSILKVRDTNVLVDAISPEEFAGDERLPYWADIWTSAYELARYCLAEAHLRDKRVLEIGCGVGLAGLAAAKVGARVTFSDYEPSALRFAEYNTLANLTPHERSGISFMQLDWRSIPALEPFDVILAADVVYERRNFFPLVDVLDKLMKKDGLAVFTEPGRTIGEHFFSMLREYKYNIDTSTHAVQIGGRLHNVTRALVRKQVPS